MLFISFFLMLEQFLYLLTYSCLNIGKAGREQKASAIHKYENDYLLITKLFCGYCGAYLCRACCTSHTGNVYRYYKCASVKKKRTDCRKKSVRKEWI